MSNKVNGQILCWFICILNSFSAGFLATTHKELLGYMCIAIIMDIFAWRLFIYEEK